MERRNAKADAISQRDAERGGDRPDPGTVGAIATDAAGKIQIMKSQGVEGDLQQMLLDKLDAKGNIKADIMSEFKSGLANNLSSPSQPSAPSNTSSPSNSSSRR